MEHKQKSVSLSFFAEALNILGTFVQWASFAALHDLAYLFNNVRIGQGGHIASVHASGDRGKDAPHDFARAGFRHVGHDMDALGAGDFADHGLNGGSEL